MVCEVDVVGEVVVVHCGSVSYAVSSSSEYLCIDVDKCVRCVVVDHAHGLARIGMYCLDGGGGGVRIVEDRWVELSSDEGREILRDVELLAEIVLDRCSRRCVQRCRVS